MDELVKILGDLGGILWALVQLLVVQVGGLVLRCSLLIVWIAWCLWGVDWRRGWAFLAQGAWAPLVLIIFMIAAIWSWMLPSEATLLGAVMVPNFWWQLLTVTFIVGIGLFCGWIQSWRRWEPPEIELHPAHVEHDDHHGGHHH